MSSRAVTFRRRESAIACLGGSQDGVRSVPRVSGIIWNKEYGLSITYHMSEIEPPAQVKGVAPNAPARKRKDSCAPILGARAAAMRKTMNINIVEM